jgi:transcriptional regulator with XRE-family HTH domain
LWASTRRQGPIRRGSSVREAPLSFQLGRVCTGAMPDRRRRATATRMRARQRARILAGRIGVGLRESRLALRITQRAASARAGISQSFWSRAESGKATSASLETLAACAAAVNAELAAFLQAVPGTDLPRDIEHIRRQELVARTAKLGAWVARPERPIDPLASRSRSIDVYLERAARREAVAVEIVDLLSDVGGALRGLEDKVAALRRERAHGAAEPWRVAGLLVLRATGRNRRLLAELRTVFASRFPSRSATWLRAIVDPAEPMPAFDGLVWSSVAGDRMFAARPVGPSDGGVGPRS